jgi:hypothetical protein
MDVRITIETTFDNGEKRTHQLEGISRPYRVTWVLSQSFRLAEEQSSLDTIMLRGQQTA